MRSEDGGVQAVGGCETGVGIAKAETGPGKQARSQKQHQREGNLCRQCREAHAQASTGYSDARERGGEAVAAPCQAGRSPKSKEVRSATMPFKTSTRAFMGISNRSISPNGDRE